MASSVVLVLIDIVHCKNFAEYNPMRISTYIVSKAGRPKCVSYR